MNKKDRIVLAEALNRQISVLHMYDGNNVTLTLEHEARFIENVAETMGVGDRVDYCLLDTLLEGFVRGWVVTLSPSVDKWWDGMEGLQFWSIESSEVEWPNALAIPQAAGAYDRLLSSSLIESVDYEVWGKWVAQAPISLPAGVTLLDFGANVFIFSKDRKVLRERIRW